MTVAASRVLAVTRYLLALLVDSQRYLLPVLLALAVLGVLFGGDPGPPPTPWAASALAMYPLAAWLALIVANVEDPVQRTVTVAAAGGRAAVAAATLLIAMAGDLVLVVLAVFGPVLLTRYTYPPATIVLGLLAHVACTTAGTAVGLLCARPVVRRIGWSFALAVPVIVVTAVQPWLPPVGTAVKALSSAGDPPLPSAVLGVVLAGLAAFVAWWVDTRG
jgi:hypothetical protein